MMEHEKECPVTCSDDACAVVTIDYDGIPDYPTGQGTVQTLDACLVNNYQLFLARWPPSQCPMSRESQLYPTVWFTSGAQRCISSPTFILID